MLRGDDIQIAHKELNETEVWLQIIIESGLQRRDKLESLLDEYGQLARILSASIKTARQSSAK